MITDKERKLNEIRDKVYVSLKEYCVWRGVRYRAVRDAIDNGRLEGAWLKTGKSYQIKKELADKLWVMNADPQREIKLRPGEKRIDEKYGKPEALIDNVEQDGPARSNFNKARAVEKTFQAKLAQIEYNQKIEKLIERDQVIREYGEVAQMVKNSMLNIPGRIMDKIAAETDPYKCENMLRKEINEALEALSYELKR